MRPEKKSRRVSLYLQIKQPCTCVLAEFQLWLAHPQDPGKTVRKGTVKYLSSCCALVSASFCILQTLRTASLKLVMTAGSAASVRATSWMKILAL
jgi:hypothetical protein